MKTVHNNDNNNKMSAKKNLLIFKKKNRHIGEMTFKIVNLNCSKKKEIERKSTIAKQSNF